MALRQASLGGGCWKAEGGENSSNPEAPHQVLDPQAPDFGVSNGVGSSIESPVGASGKVGFGPFGLAVKGAKEGTHQFKSRGRIPISRNSAIRFGRIGTCHDLGMCAGELKAICKTNSQSRMNQQASAYKRLEQGYPFSVLAGDPSPEKETVKGTAGQNRGES